MRVVKTFFISASAVTLQAASAALDAYEREYVRWIAPVVARLKGQGCTVADRLQLSWFMSQIQYAVDDFLVRPGDGRREALLGRLVEY